MATLAIKLAVAVAGREVLSDDREAISFNASIHATQGDQLHGYTAT